MRTLLTLAFAIAACTAEQAESAHSDIRAPGQPPRPIFEVDLWPGEGIPVVQAVHADLPLRAAPDGNAAIVGRLTVKARERIQYDSTRFQTIEPAVFRVLDRIKITGRSLGKLRHLTRDQYYSSAFPDTTILLNPSDAIEYLQYRGEGTCFVRIDNQVIDANPCPVMDKPKFAAVGEPQTLWWIRPVGSSASGWILISDSTATVVKRTF